MLVMPWPYLTLLSAGYVLALTYGYLTAQAIIAIVLLLLAGFAVRQNRFRYGPYLGHALFILLALTLALHWWPGFQNARMIDQERFTENAVPFSMHLNLDKPLIGFWLLLVCPWIVGRHSFLQALKAGALTLSLTALVIGALLGSTAGKAVDGGKLLFLFALVMIVVGVVMLRGRGDVGNPGAECNREKAPNVLGYGLGTGLFSGFFGIGGGFLIVPGLMGAAGMTLALAQASSLVSVAAFGASTAANYALSGLINWPIVLLLCSMIFRIPKHFIRTAK